MRSNTTLSVEQAKRRCPECARGPLISWWNVDETYLRSTRFCELPPRGALAQSALRSSKAGESGCYLVFLPSRMKFRESGFCDTLVTGSLLRATFASGRSCRCPFVTEMLSLSSVLFRGVLIEVFCNHVSQCCVTLGFAWLWMILHVQRQQPSELRSHLYGLLVQACQDSLFWVFAHGKPQQM